jgi:hypothetical protein
MATRPFSLDTVRLPIAIGYKNDSYIADEVMPYFPVNSELFDWNKYTITDMYNIRETRMSRTGVADTVEFTATSEASRVFDEALDGAVPITDQEFSQPGLDPAARTVEGLTELVMLKREQRVANTVFNTASYDAANVVTLSGTSQFNDAASNPLTTILNALDVPLVRPNTMVLGQSVWTTLRRNSVIVQAVRGMGMGGGNSASSGIIMTDDLAMLFGVDRVLIGQARSNSANVGQASNISRLWGKNLALLHLSPLGMGQGMMPTWGWTARYGTKFVRTWIEEERGIKGSNLYRVGEQVREIVSAPGAGYYIQSAIA